MLAKQLKRGDELAGMVQAFTYAGTSAIIASLWPVNDATTRYLFERFYCYYTNGIAIADALRLTQRELRQQKYDHAYYWAAFQPFGATYHQRAGQHSPCTTPLEKAVPTHISRTTQGATPMTILEPEQILQKAINTLDKMELDLDDFRDEWNRAEKDTIYAILAPLAAQCEHISSDDALLQLAHDLISAFESNPTLRQEFFGHIDADANRQARAVSLKQHKKRHKKRLFQEHQEAQTVANEIHSQITHAMAALKEQKEGEEKKK